MRYPQDRNIHRPVHLFLNNQIYFLTVRCYHNQPFFFNKEALILKIIYQTIKKFDYRIYAWVILKNHFHLLFKIEKGFNSFIQNLNGRVSFTVNKINGFRGRRVIYQYWDRCIRNETDFWKHFNYVHNNPIKHGYIKNPDHLKQYEFSSYNQWIGKMGEKWVISCFGKYPIIDFSLPDSQ